ncbi:MAG: hypothetical protein FJ267_16955 [Planctomycetes bacterium]|nr:hypothetical protein [Planctomycetota bacterium]
MIPVISVEAIRSVVSSKDQSLYDQLLKSTLDDIEKELGPQDELEGDDLGEFNEQLDETKFELDQMLIKPTAPVAEPGCWIFLIKQIIQVKKLEINVSLSFNKGYKHFYAWEPYRKSIGSRLSREALESLQYLEDGRPLCGKSISGDGCLFAWLTHSEISALYESLATITTNDVGNPDLNEFHQDLVDSLDVLNGKGCDMILSTH